MTLHAAVTHKLLPLPHQKILYETLSNIHVASEQIDRLMECMTPCTIHYSLLQTVLLLQILDWEEQLLICIRVLLCNCKISLSTLLSQRLVAASAYKEHVTN